MSRVRVTKGRRRFTPTTVVHHHAPRPVVPLHLRAMHLATVRQTEAGR